MLCIRSELREWWKVTFTSCGGYAFCSFASPSPSKGLYVPRSCFLDTLRRWILWLLQDIHWHLGCNCLCFWKVSCCFSSFKCLLKSLYPWNFSFHILFVLNICVYICVVCVYICVCVFTHICTHTSFTIIWMGFLIYQHTSAAPVFNLDFLKKFFKLFLMKNSKQKSEETITISTWALSLQADLIIWVHKGLNTVACYCWNILNSRRSVISFMNTWV